MSITDLNEFRRKLLPHAPTGRVTHEPEIDPLDPHHTVHWIYGPSASAVQDMIFAIEDTLAGHKIPFKMEFLAPRRFDGAFMSFGHTYVFPDK